jgi:hypothetical protein
MTRDLLLTTSVKIRWKVLHSTFFNAEFIKINLVKKIGMDGFLDKYFENW